MVWNTEARPVTSNGNDDGNENVVLWTTRVGRSTGFDFTTSSVIFGNGMEIPTEFLVEEARRDKAVYGRIIAMDSLDFRTVRDSFYKQLQA